MPDNSASDPDHDITVYCTNGHDLLVRPAPSVREWMDETPEKYAYRCLPLNIANSFGWEVLCLAGFSVHWTGETGKDALIVEYDDPAHQPAISHFGSGILTFHVPALIRTKPGKSLYISGPVNRPKHGIEALSGIVETDWSDYGFTMNWRLTSLYTPVRFEKGEPFARFFPVDLGEMSNLTIRKTTIGEDTNLEQRHSNANSSRKDFLKQTQETRPERVSDQWQKTYYRGLQSDGTPAQQRHFSKLRLDDPQD